MMLYCIHAIIIIIIILHGMQALVLTTPICEGQPQQTWPLFHQVFALKILKVNIEIVSILNYIEIVNIKYNIFNVNEFPLRKIL